MKKLLPSLKEKKRYIAFNVLSDKILNKEDVERSIYNNCKSFIGEMNYAKAGVNIIPEFLMANKGIIRVNNKFVDHVKSSLMMIKEINNEKVIIRSIGVSGILNKAEVYIH